MGGQAEQAFALPTRNKHAGQGQAKNELRALHAEHMAVQKQTNEDADGQRLMRPLAELQWRYGAPPPCRGG